MTPEFLATNRRAVELLRLSAETVANILDALGDDVLTPSEAEELGEHLESIVTHALLVKGNLPALRAQSEREATEACG